ncbi:MAG: hypothetical protein LBI54_01115 [Lachnospiraceae bacterium]|jgi:hypothetical protein|nr:hypothetical protein [Lachnospiraceae bacterium]
MKGKDLLNAVGNISDNHIEGAAPGRGDKDERLRFTGRSRFGRRALAMALVAASVCVAVFAARTYESRAYAEAYATVYAEAYAEAYMELAAERIYSESSAEAYAEQAYAEAYAKAYSEAYAEGYAEAAAENNISAFYLRYLSPDYMAVLGAMAEEYGAKVYFDGLQSGDERKQYVAINKLVEYYNDEEARLQAITAITPFLDHSFEQLSEAAAFALSILEKKFDDPRIVHMADGSVVFTLFNDYSDYGSYNQLWMVKDDELTSRGSWPAPKMYIRQILPSPDKGLLAITFVSNKSEYIEIHDFENNRVSPEIMDSARVKVAADLGFDYWQSSDYENFSSIHFIPTDLGAYDDSGESEIAWLDDSTVEFRAHLWFPGVGDDDAKFIDNVLVRYDFRQKHLGYEIITGMAY